MNNIWKLTREELPEKGGFYLKVVLWDGSMDEIFYTGILELEEVRMRNYKFWCYKIEYDRLKNQ